MKTLTEIQEVVRALARDEGLVLTSDWGLEITNLSLRRMASLHQWEDFTHVDSKMTTQSGVGAYDLPERLRFQDILSMEIQDGDDLNRYKRVVPVRSEQQWIEAGYEVMDLPRLYRLYDVDSDNDTHLELRPAPKYDGKIIRITGVKEPEEFSTGEQRTPFRTKVHDDLYAHIIAVNVLAKRAQQARAQQLAAEAANLMGDMIGKEILPSEFFVSA